MPEQKGFSFSLSSMQGVRISLSGGGGGGVVLELDRLQSIHQYSRNSLDDYHVQVQNILSFYCKSRNVFKQIVF